MPAQGTNEKQASLNITFPNHHYILRRTKQSPEEEKENQRNSRWSYPVHSHFQS